MHRKEPTLFETHSFNLGHCIEKSQPLSKHTLIEFVYTTKTTIRVFKTCSVSHEAMFSYVCM